MADYLFFHPSAPSYVCPNVLTGGSVRPFEFQAFFSVLFCFPSFIWFLFFFGGGHLELGPSLYVVCFITFMDSSKTIMFWEYFNKQLWLWKPPPRVETKSQLFPKHFGWQLPLGPWQKKINLINLAVFPPQRKAI